MKKHYKGILIGIGFIVLSVILYFMHYKLFHDAHHIFIYLVGDIAFLPIEVLLVSVIFHKIIEDKDKDERLKKVNMVVGVFFSELGLELIELFSKEMSPEENVMPIIQSNWDGRAYKNAIKAVQKNNFPIHLKLEKNSLIYLEKLLASKRRLFIIMLENPILVEHDTFSDLVLSMFHAQQELSCRKDLGCLEKNDYEHLMLDVERFLQLLLLEWLIYMNHLREEYPFMYSMLLRTNPLDPEAHVEVD